MKLLVFNLVVALCIAFSFAADGESGLVFGSDGDDATVYSEGYYGLEETEDDSEDGDPLEDIEEDLDEAINLDNDDEEDVEEPVMGNKGRPQNRENRKNRKAAQKMSRKEQKANKKANKKMRSEKLGKVCQKLEKKNQPKEKALKKIPANMKQRFLQLFTQTRSQLLQCCRKSDEVEQKTCFVEAQNTKATRICEMIQQAGGQLTGFWQKRAECCQSGVGQQRCLKQARKNKRKSKAQMTPQDKLQKICQRVQRPVRNANFEKMVSKMGQAEATRWRTIFEARRNETSGCCNMPSTTDQLSCFMRLNTERFNRVCSGQEDFKPPNRQRQRHDRMEDTCCSLTGEERVNCFTDGSYRRQVTRGDEDMDEEMMADAPVPETRQSRRAQKKQARKEGKQAVKQECCEAGRLAKSEMPSDGKSIANAAQECGYKAEAYVQTRDDEPRSCSRIFTRCCAGGGRQRGNPDRKAQRRNNRRRKNQGQAGVNAQDPDMVADEGF